MCSKQKIRKIAWCLLLAALISLIPTSTFKVFADGDIVPPFPYDELQTIGNGNSYALFRVHGVEQVDYVEVIAPDSNLHGMYQHLLPGLSYSGLGGWVLQINSIAYCFKNGQKVDFDLQSLFTSSFLPVNNDDPYFSCWLEFVYTTEDIYGIDDDSSIYTGYGTRFFKAQNFYIEPAATPTPTPEEPTPTPELDTKFPTFTNAYVLENQGSEDRYENIYLIANRYYDEANSRYEYQIIFVSGHLHRGVDWQWHPVYTPDYDGYDFINNTLTFYFPNIATYANYGGKYGKNSFTRTNYLTINDVYDCTGIRSSNRGYNMVEPTDRNYQFSINEPDLNYEATAIYRVNSDGSTSRIDGDGGPTPTATPTPTSAPTPIPQPSTTPEPEDPDKNSSWGWGIVNALKYIFIPDKNKLIRLEKTTQTKFQQFGGGYDDLKHVSGFEDPVRPQNIIMNWHPVGSDSEEEQQHITLVDFEQIDFYLFQTSSGMFICECLKASFTFLMFGYLIHVIRKHFVIENNTSDESDGGGV